MKQLLSAAVVVLGLSFALADEPNIWWVAKEDQNASDELVAGRGTEALPFRTIQAALDNPDFVAGDTVLVKPGDYDEGETRATGNYQGSNRVMIAKKVYLKAYDTTPAGRAETRIIGKMGTTSSASNCGTDCIRCIRVTSAAAGTVIEGFTLKNGCAYYSDSGGSYETRECSLGGGVYVPGNVDVTVVDCVFDGCIAAYGGTAIYNGTAIRCEMKNCKMRRKGLMNGTVAFACLAHGCTYQSSTDTYIVGVDAVAVGCTFFNNSVYGIRAAGGKAYNCIFEKNRSPNVEEGAGTNDCYVSDVAKNGYFSTDFSDYSLLAGSPAIGVGMTVHRQVLLELGVPEQYLAKDLSRRDIDWDAETMNAGAEQGVGTVTTIDVSDPYGELICEAAGETRIVEDRAPWQVTVRANTATNRHPKGFTVNGVEHPFSSYPGCETLSIGPSGTGSQTISIAPMAADWYVDAVGGDDTNDGFTAGLAKRTLAEVFTNCAVRAGDTVYALPGTYDKGVMRQDGDTRVWSRAVVPEGVTLAALGSAEETIILGADSPEPVNAYGQGPDAVRCLYAKQNSAIRGLTLTGGRTQEYGGAVTADAEVNGGGVLAANNTVLVSDCVISNNVAGYGGGTYYGQIVKCRLLGNRATKGGSGAAGRYGYYYGCLVDDNEGQYTIMYPSGVYSCTIGYNKGGRGIYFSSPTARSFKVFNSILYKTAHNQSVNWNCLIYTNYTADYRISAEKLEEGQCRGFASYDDFKLDENLRPLKDSPAVDAGDGEKRGSYFPAMDPDGVPRVLNGGRFDIGAFEYDWRVDYAKDLGRGITVTDVSSNVVETADGKVEVPEGFLKLDWQSKGRPLVFKAQVTGAGSLAVIVNGELFMTLTETDEPKAFRIPKALDLTKLEFVFTGSGSATLADFRRESGLVLLVW